jgi:uncharacterized protein with GYD domain
MTTYVFLKVYYETRTARTGQEEHDRKDRALQQEHEVKVKMVYVLRTAEMWKPV